MTNRSWCVALAACLIILEGLFLACGTTYSSQDLKKGITGQFVTGSTNKVEVDRFDWSKLKGDYGLFAFSYRLAAFGGKAESRDTIEYHSGLRIFKHKFKSGRGDTTLKVIDFPVLKEKTPQFGFTEVSTLHLRLRCIFVKHQLTYGGVLEIDARPNFPEVVAELWPDSLFTKFLAANKNRWQSIPVDTIKINTKSFAVPDSSFK